MSSSKKWRGRKQDREPARRKSVITKHLYYVKDDPELSDAGFDRLIQQLKKLEEENPKLVTPDSPTQRVGGKPREGFQTVQHKTPMVSLDNAFSFEELANFDKRVHELTGRGRDRIHRGAQIRRIEHVAAIREGGSGAGGDARRWNYRRRPTSKSWRTDYRIAGNRGTVVHGQYRNDASKRASVTVRPRNDSQAALIPRRTSVSRNLLSKHRSVTHSKPREALVRQQERITLKAVARGT